MADDKGGGGGGWEWGALEIILGILLLVGVLDHIFGKAPLGSKATTSAAPVVQEVSGDWCGLRIENPQPNDKIGTVITIAGSVGECDWKTAPGIALYAQVVDSKGKPVSGYLPVPPTQSRDGFATFNATIALTAKPTAGTGYLILVPAVQPGSPQTVSARIPIKL